MCVSGSMTWISLSVAEHSRASPAASASARSDVGLPSIGTRIRSYMVGSGGVSGESMTAPDQPIDPIGPGSRAAAMADHAVAQAVARRRLQFAQHLVRHRAESEAPLERLLEPGQQ